MEPAPPVTFIDILERRAAEHGDRVAFRFLTEGTVNGNVESWTFADLSRRARAVATALGGLRGERALLLYPPGLDFVSAFFGCLYAGVVAVPAYPPDPSRLERMLPRLRRVAADARPAVVLSLSFIEQLSAGLASRAPELGSLPWIATDTLREDAWSRPDVGPGDLAFLQYTSGSTGDPKGVMLTHKNLLHNEGVIRDAFGHTEGFGGVGWLPLFHDMGLIGHVLQPVLMGGTSVLMSPLNFLRNPVRWLQAISRFRPWTSGGPNFAYALAARKVTDAELAELDLSSWEVAYCGAEKVRPETLHAFADRFAPAGFRREALLPCYGLAEGTLMATCAPRGPLRTVSADAARLEAGTLIDGDDVGLASVGTTLHDQRLLVVDPGTRRPVPDGRMGEIWLQGPSVARGYWGRAELSEEVFAARTADGAGLKGGGAWLRTRDQGVLRDGALYVTGRLDDMILLRGRNVFPDDLEQAAEASHPAIGGGRTAAFAVEGDEEPEVVLVCEVAKGEDPGAVVAAVRGAVSSRCEVTLSAVGLLRRGSLPKTSSGKRQRRATRDAWLAGSLNLWHQARPDAAPADGLAAREASDLPSPPGSLPETAEGMAVLLATEIGALLGQPPEHVARDVPFADLGLDSVRVVELSERLGRRLHRPLHATVLFNIPTVERLAAWLVDGRLESGDGSEVALYGDLDRALGHLERRKPEVYRFDLEADVAWDRVDEQGLYVPREMLRSFGVDTDAVEAVPEAWRMLQVAGAMTLCAAFEITEVTIVMFLDTRRTALGATRTLDHFREEEIKHIALFRRCQELLAERHPEIAGELRWDPAWGVGFWELFRHPELFTDEQVYHYLLWSFIVAVEEHSTWFAGALRGLEGVQPAWASMHAAHHKEERQHVANDAAYLRALDLDPAERETWSEVVVAWLGQHYDTFFAFGPARQLVARHFPNLAPHLVPEEFTRSGFFEELLSSPSYRQTRRACPYLRELAETPAEERPDSERLARRLPEAWLTDGVPLAPRAVVSPSGDLGGAPGE